MKSFYHFSNDGECSAKAGAAHIAFSAPSRSVVDAFFFAALKAGGRIHGEPVVRDQETGYYSAAVLDFDDNSIEVMHREEKVEASGTASGDPGEHRVLKWQKEVVRSTVGSDVKSENGVARIVINNIATPTTKVSYSPPEPRPGSEMSAKALVGTLLGAAAGAAVAYAMTKGEEESQKASAAIPVLYQAIEAARPLLARSATEPVRSYAPSNISLDSRTGPRELEYSRSSVSQAIHDVQSHVSSSERRASPLAITSPLRQSTLIDTFLPPSEIVHFRPHPLVRNNTDSITHHSSGSRMSNAAPQRLDSHSRVSSAKTITQVNLGQLRPPSVATEVKAARGVPLPESRATSTASSRAPSLRRQVLDGGCDNDVKSVLGSVAPSDSVSQAGSKRSKGGRNSSRRSSPHRSEKSKERRKHKDSDGGSQASEKTVRAEGSRTGRRRESVVSLPMRPASKASVHRSVRSFIPGM